METHDDCRLVRVLTALACEPWLLSPSMHKQLTDIAKAHAFGGMAERLQHEKAAAMPANPAPTRYSLVDVCEEDTNGKPTGAKLGTVAVIPITDVIGRKFSSCLYSSGVTSIDVFQRLVKTAAEDDAVLAILITIDSPGGVAMGTPEAAESVRRACESKPVMAYADGLVCSAAYWIASQCCAVYAMPSAQVGCIGAYMAMTDVSRALEMEGIHVELFKSGKHKGMGYPGTSLTDEQRDMLRSQVMQIAGTFKTAVRTGRGKQIADEAMQGQTFDVDQAKALGLIDQISDFDTAVRDAAKLGRAHNAQKQKQRSTQK
jgi:signal peptide peptidase SppA